MSDATVRKVIAGLLALFLGFALNATRLVVMAHAQAGGCMNGCDYGPLDPNVPWERKQIKENKRAAKLRKHYEEKWGKNFTDGFPDEVLARIHKNPTDSDCWQSTPTHCY